METAYFQMQGRRPYQEDSYYLDPNNEFFIICDGLGGSTYGELASQTVINSVRRQIREESKSYDGEENIQSLLDQAWQDLMKKLDEKPESRGMGTTFVGAFFKDGYCYVAHVGDSRFYHIRPGDGMKWCTKDHSVVQQLFDKGLFSSKKEMEGDPRSPQITRAFIASEKREAPEADIKYIDDLKKGDILMLCSDGLIETFKGDSAVEILSSTKENLQEKADSIEETCRERSSDNTTAVFIEMN